MKAAAKQCVDRFGRLDFVICGKWVLLGLGDGFEDEVRGTSYVLMSSDFVTSLGAAGNL